MIFEWVAGTPWCCYRMISKKHLQQQSICAINGFCVIDLCFCEFSRTSCSQYRYSLLRQILHHRDPWAPTLRAPFKKDGNLYCLRTSFHNSFSSKCLHWFSTAKTVLILHLQQVRYQCTFLRPQLATFYAIKLVLVYVRVNLESKLKCQSFHNSFSLKYLYSFSTAPTEDRFNFASAAAQLPNAHFLGPNWQLAATFYAIKLLHVFFVSNWQSKLKCQSLFQLGEIDAFSCPQVIFAHKLA